MPTAASVVLALVRRDLAQRRIVRFALALDLVFGALNLIVYQFIGRVLRHPAPGSVTAAGGYFSFASVGIAFFLVVQTATTGVSRQIREEQYSGTLEFTVAQPIGSGSLALGLSLFPVPLRRVAGACLPAHRRRSGPGDGSCQLGRGGRGPHVGHPRDGRHRHRAGGCGAALRAR